MVKICEDLRKQVDPTLNCEDWWMITDPSNYTLIKLSLFFKNKKIVSAIMDAHKIELLSVSLLQFFSFEGNLDQSLWIPFKNLMFFLHQNILILNKFLLERLPKTGKPNLWAGKIKKLIESKLIRLYKDKQEALQALTLNIDSCRSVLKSICSLKPWQPIHVSVKALVEDIEVSVQISNIIG